ncbi:MAG TPA: AAA family ATPase [Gammaproteobacteria bacterium]|nr:AAA family ATPase [Gammaproteobacteria bacterium]
MYTEFFGLNEKPFAITPDPRYLYMSARHTDALAHLVYGISESGGFIQLTGEVGTGKTTLIRSLLERMPEKADIALILSPQLTTVEFLQTIADELGCLLPREVTVKAIIDNLNSHLLRVHAAGRRVVLIVDEAQTLSPELLEQVRLLTNLETAKHKLLQIILIGQPELRALLDRPDMRQIAQRVTGRYHLEPLDANDTAAYVRHRMRVAGAQRDIFTNSALRALYRRARGIPRLINVIADRALLAAYTQDRHTVDGQLVALAAAEVFGRRSVPSRRWWWAAAVAAGIALFAFATTNLWRDQLEPGQAPAAAVETSLQVAGAPAPPAADAAPIVVAAATSASAGTPAGQLPAQPQSRPATLHELLTQPDFAQTADEAIGTLLTLWGARYDAARREPCQQAQEQGLRCLLQSRGTLGELKRVNWPTIVQLVTEDGVRHPVVIAALHQDTAQVVAHGKTFELPLAEIGFSWYGDHLLLWRPGNAPKKDLVPGVDDVGVLWLRGMLARVQGSEPPVDASTVYDAALVREVKAYQRERQLTVDGIVGERTQIAMLADLKLPDTPLLLAER